MRTSVLIVGTLLLALLFAIRGANAQSGVKKPPRMGATNTPARPSTLRGGVDSGTPTRPASRPAAGRFADDSPIEEGAGYNEAPQEAEPPPRGGSRFVSPPEEEESPAMEEEPEEVAPARQEYRSASRETRPLRREPAARMIEPEEEELAPTDAGSAPAPLENRGAARSIEAQPIQVMLNESPAGVVLSSALHLEHPSAISGYPIRLDQVLAASSDTQSRRIAVRAYWNLVISIADYHFALDEFDRISQISARSGDKLIEAAAAAAEARVAETHLTAMAAQFDLAAFSPSATALPIPADAPVIGEYRTEYTALFGRGPAPVAIRRLAAMLPLYRDQVVARGKAVYAASEAMMSAEDLTTFKELSAHRRAFLASVRDYNDSIADYALQLTTPGMSIDVVTSMLIVRATPAADAAPDLTGGVSRSSAAVVRASASAPVETPMEKSVVRPRRSGGFRDAEEPSPLGPDEADEAIDAYESAAPSDPDATEAPARGGSRLQFGPGEGPGE